MPKNAVFIVLFCVGMTQNSESFAQISDGEPTVTHNLHISQADFLHPRSQRLFLLYARFKLWQSSRFKLLDFTQHGLNTQWVSEIGKSNSHFGVWGTLTNIPLTGVLPLNKHTHLPFSHQASNFFHFWQPSLRLKFQDPKTFSMHRQEVGIYIVSSVALCKEIRVDEKTITWYSHHLWWKTCWENMWWNYESNAHVYWWKWASLNEV